MANNLRTQIYKNFNSYDTESLIEIWEVNNRTEWSDTTFEVLAEILQERLDSLPPQGEAIYDKNEFQESFFTKVKRWFSTDDDMVSYSHPLQEGNGPAFYDPQEVVNIYRWMNKIAKAMIPISIVLGLSYIPQTATIVRSYFINSYQDMTIIVWFITLIIIAIGTVLQVVFTYYPLKALAYILKILMEVEHNSRK